MVFSSIPPPSSSSNLLLCNLLLDRGLEREFENLGKTLGT
jgi:hypothetical protein